MVSWSQKTPLRGDEPNNDLQKLTGEPSHADSSGRESLKTYDGQFTPITSGTFRSFLRRCENHESAGNASGIYLQGGIAWTKEDVKTLLLRMESQELNTSVRMRSGLLCSCGGFGPSTASLANQAPVYCGCPAGTHGCDLVSSRAPDLLLCGWVSCRV